MAAPVLTWTDSLDVAIDSANPLAFVNASPGATTASMVARLHNDLAAVGGIDDAVGYGVIAQAKLTVGGAEFLNEGVQTLDIGAFRIAISPTSPEGVPSQALGLGGGRALQLPTVPAGSFVELDVDFNLPANVSTSGVTFTLNHTKLLSSFVGAVPNGLRTRIGDSTAYYVAAADGLVEPAGPADDTVSMPESTVVAAGRKHFEAAEFLAFDDLDGSAAALVAGESYAALLTYTAAGRVVVKGDKSAGTPVDPAPPADSFVRARVVVPFGLVIVEVVPFEAEGNFNGTASGSDLTVSGGYAYVDSFDVFPRTPTVLSLVTFLSAEVDVYVTRDGGLLITLRGVPLAGAPLPLWRAATDGAGLITGLEDLRLFAPGEGYL